MDFTFINTKKRIKKIINWINKKVFFKYISYFILIKMINIKKRIININELLL